VKEWLVRLKGEKFDLQDLPVLLTSPEVTVIEEDGKYYLKSEDFNSLTDAGDVLAASKPILETINGALLLYLGGFQTIEADGTVIGIDENGKHHNYAFISPTSIIGRSRVSARLTVMKTNGTVNSSRQPSKVKSWIAVARQNKNVADAFHFFGKPTWSNLYKAYEIIRDDVGGENEIVEKGWVKKSNITRFRRTAQNPEVLGDDARHARTKDEPPKKPMPLSEATSLIQTLLKNWLRSKQ